MQKIITGSQVKKLDQKFIQQTGISSFDLMERAANSFVEWFLTKFTRDQKIGIFCGVGNNGGDGLAIGRILASKGYYPWIYFIGELDNSSSDFKINFSLLPDYIPKVNLSDYPNRDFNLDIIIDAVFGVGLNRPLSNSYSDLIQWLNDLDGIKIAVDIPSGMPSDGMLNGEAFKATYTVTFQFPKLSLLFPEHAPYTGELVLRDIGISKSFFDDFSSGLYYCTKEDIPKKHIQFHRFSHKGDFGRILLLGGSFGKMGSMVLSSQAALRTGSGLVTCHVPECGLEIIQNSIPEVMVQVCKGNKSLTSEVIADQALDSYDAVGAGPGMGTDDNATNTLKALLQNFSNALVLDADAINILSANKDLFSYLREGIVLTPHLKEFERLVGKCSSHLERMEKAKEFARKYNCVLILKGANTLINLPDGRQIFNSTGTQYMGTAGSGDVLTGMLSSFLGQGYSPENAAICGVFHHGLAGEIAAASRLRGTIASDIIEWIPETFVRMGIA